MITSHHRRRRLAFTLVALCAVLATSLLPAKAGPAAAARSGSRLTTCDELLAVKEWTATFAYSWDAEGSHSEFDYTGRASMAESGNIWIKFKRMADEETGEPLWRWQSAEVGGAASIVGDARHVWQSQSGTFVGTDHTIAVGGVGKNNLGDFAGGSYLEIDPEACTYDLHLSPYGPDGDTWQILTSGERVTWDEDDWHIISGLTLYNEPIALPAGDALPTIAVSRMMAVDPVMPDGTGSGEIDVFDSGSAISRQYIEEWYDGPLTEGLSEIGASANVFWSLVPEPFGRPTVALDREFLERSIFLSDVPVDHWFDSQVTWGDDSSGTHTWKAASRAPEVSGVTSARTIRKTENLALQGLGNQPVTTQVRSLGGAKSLPQTTNLWLTKVPSWCATVSGNKLAHAVNYRCGFKAPEPAFEAKLNMPSFLPWVGGEPFGINETQASMDLEVNSTGEGSVKGQGQLGFEAMGSSIYGWVAGKGVVFLGPDGIRIPSGTIELGISGKISKDESLVKAVPAFAAAMTSLEALNKPIAQWLKERAKGQIELELKQQFNLELQTKGDEIVIKGDDLQTTIGVKLITFVELFDKVVKLQTSVGGEFWITIQVPGNPGYLKEIGAKLTAAYAIKVWRFMHEGEKTWSWSSNGPAAQFNADPQEALASANWSLMDRSYLQSAGYADWTGLSASAVITDQQLMGNIDPLANPALALGSGQQYVVWSHDKPGSPALSGQELAFASGNPRDWAGGWTQLTSDDRADFNPRTVTLPNGRVLALWQRLDTANPGDINADPAGFMSHFQVAAAAIDPNTPALTAPPFQLSAGGRLSHRPHLGALGDGALALWVANDQNQILGSAASPDDVLWSRYSQDADSWSQPMTLLGDVAGLGSLQLATSYDADAQVSHAALVYSLDSDGDLGTDADLELFAITGDDSAGEWSWAAPRRLTTNGLADSAPQLALDPDGAPVLIWRQGDGLRFLQGDWGAQAQPLDLGAVMPSGAQLVRGDDGALALVWQEVENHDTAIGYAFYDAEHGLWSDARTLQPAAGTHSASGASVAVTSVEPALITDPAGGPLLALAYQMSDVKAVTRTVEGISVPNIPELGASHLRMAYVPLSANLAVRPADLRALPANAEVGQAVTLDAAVRNEGLLPIDGATVELVRESLGSGPSETLGARTLPAIAGGGVVTATFALTRPERADYRYIVRVLPPEDATESNLLDNEAILGMELSATTLSTLYSPGAAVAQVLITSTSALPSTAPQRLTLSSASPDGPLLHDTWVSLPVTSTAGVTVALSVLPDDVGPGQHFLYWNLDPGQTLGERDRSDNTAGTLVVVGPDLAAQPELVEFGRRPGTSAAVSLWVRNEGSLGSAAGTLAVHSAPPGQSGSRLLGTLSLPALAPGAVARVAGTLNLSGQPEAATGLRTLAIQLDPANAQVELNENNNLIVVGEPFGAGATPGVRVYLPLLRR